MSCDPDAPAKPAKPLRWKQILPNTERGWLLRRGDVVLGKVIPLRGRMTTR